MGLGVWFVRYMRKTEALGAILRGGPFDERVHGIAPPDGVDARPTDDPECDRPARRREAAGVGQVRTGRIRAGRVRDEDAAARHERGRGRPCRLPRDRRSR